MTQITLNAWLAQKEPPFWEFAGVIIPWDWTDADNDDNCIPCPDRCLDDYSSPYASAISFWRHPPNFYEGWYM
jgi:hypothetical protein